MNSGLVLLKDWETTGLTLHPNAEARKQPRAIEFGAVLFDCAVERVVDEFECLINPEVDVEPIITKITGHTNEKLRAAPPFRDVYKDILPFYQRASGLVSHNLPFDKQILITELTLLGVAAFPWPQHELCTVNYFTPHWGRFPKLTEVYEMTFGRPLLQTHTALDDVKAMTEVFIEHKIWRFM